MRESVVPKGTRKFALHPYLAMNRQATVSRPCGALAELKKQSISTNLIDLRSGPAVQGHISSLTSVPFSALE
jgi:hypothetical protein